MRKVLKTLSVLELNRLKKVGLHAVGEVSGLCLKVDPQGSKSWVLRAMVGGRRRNMGLGGYPSTTMADAKKSAREARELIAQGIDPISKRNKVKEGSVTITFAKASEIYISAKSVEWKNPKHHDQWRNTLKDYCSRINSMDVSQIETHHIRLLLEEIWLTKTETATRIRGRIESILDWATVQNYRKGENPARWKGHLEHLLPSPKNFQRVKHHEALPYKDAPNFMKQLSTRHDIASRCLEFLILTCTRTTEAREATWSEIDFKKKIWVLSAERMKAKKGHVVALSNKAIELLKSIVPNGDYIFSFNGKKAISTIDNILRQMEVDATVHGFRSTFKDWAVEKTTYSNDLSEAVLAHSLGSSVELAYKRTDYLEQRYLLMEDWASYLYKKVT